jgi:hypothetical protein
MGWLISGSDGSTMVDNTDADTGEGTQTDDASSTGDKTGADTGEGTQTEEGEQNSDKLYFGNTKYERAPYFEFCYGRLYT